MIIFKGCLFFVLAIVLLASCSSVSKNETDYTTYFENPQNGLRKQMLVGKQKYDLQLKTPEYIICKEGLAGDAKKERLQQLKNTIWFNVKLSSVHEDKGIPEKAQSNNTQDKLNYFLMQAESNYALTCNGVELNKIAYHFQNNHGVVPNDVMIIGYKLQGGIDGDIVLTYQDKLHDNQLLKITIESKDIDNIPKLRG